jgi:hypothetical protein
MDVYGILEYTINEQINPYYYLEIQVTFGLGISQNMLDGVKVQR